VEDEPGPAGVRLGGPVAGLIRSQHDDELRELLRVQMGGVAEAALEHGRGPAAVLGRAEDQDHVGAVDTAGLVGVSGLPDGHATGGDDAEQAKRRDDQDGENGMSPAEPHETNLAAGTDRTASGRKGSHLRKMRTPSLSSRMR
jgi:hypothetical protein